MSRRYPWKNKPTEEDLVLINKCSQTQTSTETESTTPTNPRLYLINEVGVTQFLVSCETDPNVKYRVSIGDTQSCSCKQSRTGVSLCVHLMFVMMRVLRLDKIDPRVWQLSLTEVEILDIVQRRHERRRQQQLQRQRQKQEEEKQQMQETSAQTQQHATEKKTMCRVDWNEEDRDGAQLIKQLKHLELERSTKSNTTALSTTDNTRMRLSRDIKCKCTHCHAVIHSHQPLYLCVTCRKQHVCKACFGHYIRQTENKVTEHKHHYLLRNQTQQQEDENTETSWAVPVLPSLSSSSHSAALSQLQQRELSTADYELLLQLDRTAQPLPVYSYLATALPTYHSSQQQQEIVCVFCSSPAISSVHRCVSLSCSHIAHEHCVSSLCMYEYDIHCTNCNTPVFIGIHCWKQRLLQQQQQPRNRPKHHQHGRDQRMPPNQRHESVAAARFSTQPENFEGAPMLLSVLGSGFSAMIRVEEEKKEQVIDYDELIQKEARQRTPGTTQKEQQQQQSLIVRSSSMLLPDIHHPSSQQTTCRKKPSSVKTARGSPSATVRPNQLLPVLLPCALIRSASQPSLLASTVSRRTSLSAVCVPNLRGHLHKGLPLVQHPGKPVVIRQWDISGG